MKACPFCAEEIQDAAIVCKHCKRDLDRQVTTVVDNRTVTATVPPRSRVRRFGPLVFVIVAFTGACYFLNDHMHFVDWQTRRDAWHQRCDQFLETPLTNPAAENCNRELVALSNEAKANGWISK